MGIHGLFKRIIGGEAINEASATDVDYSYRKGTQRDNMSSFFAGMSSGIMIPSAMTNGKIPVWNDADITYPFVGIVGYSTHGAATSVKNRQKSYMDDFFGIIMSDPTVKSALNSVISNGGIPVDSFIFYPDIPVSAVGSGNSSRSLSVFLPMVMSSAVQSGIGDMAVQQCLDLDDNGEIFVNPDKRDGNVFFPSRKGDKFSAKYISRITIDDLVRIVANMGGKKELVDMLTLAFRSFVAKETKRVNGEPVMADPTKSSIDQFNPKAGKFFEFFKELNPSLSDAKLDEYLKTNPNALVASFVKWLNASSERTICERLISKYYFPTPFGHTYCMREMGDVFGSLDSDTSAIDRDYEIYRACVENASAETAEEIVARANGSTPTGSPSAPQSAQFSYGDSAELTSTDMKSALMEICRRISSGEKRNTYCFKVRDDRQQRAKEDDKVIQRHEGMKRVFIRILHSSTSFKTDFDRKFLSSTTDKFITSPFTLDYSDLFRRFGARLDKNAPVKFNCHRISGYTITHAYDETVESMHDEGSPSYIDDLLDSYNEIGGEINEPSSFSISYFKDGDFISSGYDDNLSFPLSRMGSDGKPESLKRNRYGVQEDRIRSHFIYAAQRVGLVNKDNKELLRIIPKRHSVDKTKFSKIVPEQ